MVVGGGGGCEGLQRSRLGGIPAEAAREDAFFFHLLFSKCTRHRVPADQLLQTFKGHGTLALGDFKYKVDYGVLTHCTGVLSF